METDSQLLIRIKNGDLDALVDLCRAEYTWIYKVSFMFTRNEELATQLTSDIFENIWNHRNQLNPDLPLDKNILDLSRQLILEAFKKGLKLAKKQILARQTPEKA